MIFRPPPLIWEESKPARAELPLDHLEQEALGAAVALVGRTSGNFGSFAAYSASSAGVMLPVSAIECST